MNIQVPVKIKPMPLGDVETVLLDAAKGTRIRDVLPEEFTGLIAYNHKLLNYNENPIITEYDDIEFLVPLSGGGGGKDALRTVAFLSVAILSAGLGASVAAYGVWAKAAVSVSVMAAGGLLVNTLIPPQMPEQTQTPDAGAVPGFSTKSLLASQNKPGSYQEFPKLYGERRIKPYYAASPYTEIVGDDQYLHFLFFLNFGPISVPINVYPYTNVAGLFKGESVEDRSITLTDTTGSPRLTPGTIKIDETSLDSLNDWKLIIGSANRIQSDTGFRDAEVKYPNIAFEAGYDYQAETFSFNYLGAQKIFTIPDKTLTSSFQFTRGAYDTNRQDAFTIRYEKKSEQGSGRWHFIRPAPDSGFFSDREGYDNIWQTSGMRESMSSGLVKVEHNIGRLWVRSSTKRYTFFEDFKFYSKDHALYTTAPNTYAASVDLVASNGLYYMNNKNQRKRLTLKYEVEYRPVGTGTWTRVRANRVLGKGFADNTAKLLSISGSSAKTYRAGLYFEFPEVGQYDVRIIPTSKTSFSGFAQESVTWETLKSYQSKGSAVWAPFLDGLDVPTNHPDYDNLRRNCTLMYLKIKAQPTLQGNTNNISINCASVLRDVKHPAKLYKDKGYNRDLSVSANPINIYLDTLLGDAIVNPVDESKIDWPELEDAADFATRYGLYYSNYEVKSQTVLERLNKVLSTSLMSFGVRDSLFSVLRDKPDQPAVQVITPANCNSFTVSKSFNKKLHGVKVQYTDKNTWETNYVLVYNTGYSLDGAGGTTAASEFITLEVEGITDIEHAKIYGRYHLAGITLRPETYNTNMDIENIRLELGDCVYIAYDTIKVSEIHGRVKSVKRNSANQVVSIETAELVTDVQAGKGIAFRLQDGSSFHNTYPVDVASTTETEIFLKVPTAINLNPGDVFTYGDIGAEKLKAKVTNIYPGKDMTADIELVNAAEDMHETYTKGTIPSYEPVIDTRVETGLTKPPKPIPTAIDSGDNFIVTSEAQPESYAIKIDFTLPYTQIGVDNIVVEYIEQYYETTDWDSAVYGPGVFEESTYQTVSASAIKKEINQKLEFPYTGQSYILFEAIQTADYEIKLYSNKKSGGVVRVSDPSIIEYTALSGTVNKISNLEFIKEQGQNGRLSWSDPENNFPTIFRIFEYNEKEQDWDLIGTTTDLSFDLGRRFVTGIFAVRAVNLSNNNGSAKVRIRVNMPIPTMPTIIGKTLDGKIELSWDSASIEIDEYEIREGTDWKTGTFVGKTSGNSILIPKEDPQIYYFMVVGKLIDGQETKPAYIDYHYPFGMFGDKPNQKPGLKWEKDLTLTIGQGELFERVEDALEYFAGMIVGYGHTAPYRVQLILSDGYTFDKQIKIENFDFSFMTIVGSTTIGNACYVNFTHPVESFAEFNNGEETFHCKPLFVGINAKLPILNTFNLAFADNFNTNGASICYLRGSEIVIERDFYCGFEGYGNFGFFLDEGAYVKNKPDPESLIDWWQIDNIRGLGFYVKDSDIFLYVVIVRVNAIVSETKTGFLYSSNSKVAMRDVRGSEMKYLVYAENQSKINVASFSFTQSKPNSPVSDMGFVTLKSNSIFEFHGYSKLTFTTATNPIWVWAEDLSIFTGTSFIGLWWDTDLILKAKNHSYIRFKHGFESPKPWPEVIKESTYLSTIIT